MRRLCIAIAIVAMGLPEVICRQFTKEEGPYETHVYNVSSCIVEKPWFHVNVTTYTINGRSLLRGRIVTQRPIKNVKVCLKRHQKCRYIVSNYVVEKTWFHANVTAYISNGRSLLRYRSVTQRPMKTVKVCGINNTYRLNVWNCIVEKPSFHAKVTSIQLYYMEQGKTKAFELKNQNCHNVVMRVILQSLGIRYNAQRCTMQPTISEFSNLDLNAILHSHAVGPYVYYGTVVIRWEIAIPATPLMCLDIYLQFLKLNGKKLQ